MTRLMQILLLLVATWFASGFVLAMDAADLPVDAPDDAIMATPGEVAAMADWAAAVFADKRSHEPGALLASVGPPFSFVYGGKSSVGLLKQWQHTAEAADLPDRTRRQAAWTDPQTGLRVTAEVALYKRYPAVDWVLSFENQGKQDTLILADIQALDCNVRTGAANQPAILHQIAGDSCSEHSYLPGDTVLTAGQTIAMAPVGGRSSNGTFPFFNLQCADEGLIAAIGWTGQWAASLERAKDGSTHLRAGMEKTHLVLHPGERIRSPRILLMTWKGNRLAAHQRFRRLLMFHYVPKVEGRPLRLPFALQCFDRYFGSLPSWSTEAGQLAAASASHRIGANHHWFDAGWFLKGFPDGVGNWFCDPQKFPHGLKPVSDACHRKGLKFILWFEPERVAKDSQIAREHPEFVFGGRSGGLFELSDPAARRWLTDLLSRRITEYGVDVYRNDFNIDPLGFWRGNDAPDRQGMTEIRYVEGHYAMWDELRARHPGLWIDNCASGGRRIDLETCMRSVPLWRSDTSCAANHPDWNQNQTLGLSQYIPLFTACGWSPDATELRSSATAGAICQFDYLNKDFPWEQAKAALAEIKENQKYWYGDFYPLTPATLAADQWTGYQLHRADLNAGIVLAFRRAASPKPAISVKLGGIDPAKSYVVDFIDDARQTVRKVVPGRELAAETALQIPKAGSSLLLRYAPAE